MARIEEAVVESLDGHALTRRQLADAVAARVGERLGTRLKSSWGELLKPAARRGLIVNGPSRGQEITYVRADQWLTGLALEVRTNARKELLRGYLRAYGPATKKDYARWLGMRPMRPINETFSQRGSEITEVNVSDRSMFALREDLDELAGSPPFAEGRLVQLLGGFDCYLLGHADRDHLATAEQRPLI
jgi:Winged helix DNA-binding domain